MTDTISTTIDDGVAELVIDRPPANILDTQTLTELACGIRDAGRRSDVRVVLLRGEGKHFSGGVDVAEHLGDSLPGMLGAFSDACLALRECPLPTVCAAHGAVMGGGLELLLTADLSCVAIGARLGQPEIQVGVFPPVAVALLPAEIGSKNALDLLLTGRTLTAEEALRLGMIQRAWPAEQLLPEARKLACSLAGLSSVVLQATKRAIRHVHDHRRFHVQLGSVERIYMDEVMRTHDAHEGLAAFMEKRPPVWQHR